MKPFLEVLVGMIGSGKSTYAEGRADDGCIIVNDDSLITSLHGGDYLLYEASLKPLYKAVESAVIHSAILAGKPVVIDRTNGSRDTRSRYVQIAKALGVPAVATVFARTDDETHARRRVEADDRGYSFSDWLKVAERLGNGWSEPSVDEGFDSIMTKGSPA